MKTALVTGGATGLGAAVSKRLSAEGFKVYIADIATDLARAIADDLGPSAIAVELDVREQGPWVTAIAMIERQTGRLDVLVNNAGIIPTGTVESLSLEAFRDALDVNLIGPFLGCKHAIPLMRATGGSIVNMSSRAALRANPSLAGYSSSKAALTMLTKSVALHCAEQGYNIRCNSIHPGLIATQKNDEIAQTLGDMDEVYATWRKSIPLGRIGLPEEVAGLVAYLVSDEASFATGGQFVLDGGSSL